jgi:uncharacterized phiE125 gp8 family phage protein
MPLITEAGVTTSVRTVAPTVLAVDIALARANLRVDGDYLDPLINVWVKGITRKLEHDVGQCFMAQTWEVRFPAFPCGGEEVELPHPAIEITAVKYGGSDGSEMTLPTDAYRLKIGQYSSSLASSRGALWPATGGDAGVVITVKCGYGDTPDKTPETAQLFILGKLVEQYDPITRTERDTVQSVYLDRLLDDLKTYA